MTPLRKPFVGLADYIQGLIKSRTGKNQPESGAKSDLARRIGLSAQLLYKHERNPDYYIAQLTGNKAALVKVVRVFDE